jgi:hypothetical protein
VGIVPRFEIRIRRDSPVFLAWPVAPSVKATFTVLEHTGSQALYMYSAGIGAALYKVSVGIRGIAITGQDAAKREKRVTVSTPRSVLHFLRREPT